MIHLQYKEIAEIPEKADLFIKETIPYDLPLNVPYLGMGSSYFAPLAFKYMGIPIYPEAASEYFNYLNNDAIIQDNAVILSQSGKSSEALWCSKLFRKYIAISNVANSDLCCAKNAAQTILLKAGDEQFSSSKTYTNTLVALFGGFGIDAKPAVDILVKKIAKYESLGKQIAKQIFQLISDKQIHGIYILGSGPNIATALQAALILSESTKINFTGMAMAQYDHGPKETANNSIVINIISEGISYERAKKLTNKISEAGAVVFEIEEPLVNENLSIINNIVPFNFMAFHLAEMLGIKETFLVGGKVTEVNN